MNGFRVVRDTDMKTGQEAQIAEFLSRILPVNDLELIDLKIVPRRTVTSVVIRIDHPTGGVSLEECAGVNRELCRWLEETRVFDGNYSVDVCSPGLDWPLKAARDFRRVKDRIVKVWVTQEDESVRELTGRVTEVSETDVVLQPYGKKGRDSTDESVRINFSLVKKAVQYIE